MTQFCDKLNITHVTEIQIFCRYKYCRNSTKITFKVRNDALTSANECQRPKLSKKPLYYRYMIDNERYYR